MEELTPWTVYWITRLDSLKWVAEGVAVSSMLALVGMGVACALTEGDAWPLLRKWVRVGGAAFLFAMAAYAAVPTTKEMCAILVIPAIAQNEDVQALGSEIPLLAREWLQELRPDTE